MKKTALVLSSILLLASCGGAQTITKEAALEIAKGYDTADVGYKSGKQEVKFEFNFGNMPAEMQEQMKARYKDKTTDIAEANVKQYRLSEAMLSQLYVQYSNPEVKANGKALEIYATKEQDDAKMTSSMKIDENGYTTETVMKQEGKYGEYTISITEKDTFTWVK